jgi:hypothetical protein
MCADDTPKSQKVTARAELIEVDRRKLRFKVEVCAFVVRRRQLIGYDRLRSQMA